jgi:hypothetical protein
MLPPAEGLPFLEQQARQPTPGNETDDLEGRCEPRGGQDTTSAVTR